MKGTLLAVRAIGSQYANILWWWSVSIALAVSVALILVLVPLTELSSWWWLLAIPIGIVISVAAGVLAVFRLVISYVRPKQTATQKQLIQAFIGRLQGVSEVTSTPKFMMLFRVIRSIAAPSSDTYLQQLLDNKDLHKDFIAIAKTFNGVYGCTCAR